MLTQEYVRSRIIYCPLTGVTIWKTKVNNRIKQYSTCGTITNDGYMQTTFEKKKYQLHNVIWLYMEGDLPYGQIDHKDGKRDNNQWSNLRDVTIRENHQNQVEHRNGKLPGVQQIDNSFVARTWVNGERVYIGCYHTAEEAYRAYCKYLDSIGEKHL